MSDFFRYPHTPHLAWLGSTEPRDDKVLSPEMTAALLSHRVTIEEKVDGANLGIFTTTHCSLCLQNRGQYLRQPFSGQFARLSDWLGANNSRLSAAIEPGVIAFGEWCAAQHSLEYTHLPDWWLLFDIFDRHQNRFWSSCRRDQLARGWGFSSVATIAEGKFALDDLVEIVLKTPSNYKDGIVEGIVIRADTTDWSVARAKLVHPDFVQKIGQHWRKKTLRWNRKGE